MIKTKDTMFSIVSLEGEHIKCKDYSDVQNRFKYFQGSYVGLGLLISNKFTLFVGK